MALSRDRGYSYVLAGWEIRDLLVSLASELATETERTCRKTCAPSRWPFPGVLRRSSYVGITACGALPNARGMFVVIETDAAAIRTVFDQGGKLPASVELRGRPPAIVDNIPAWIKPAAEPWHRLGGYLPTDLQGDGRAEFFDDPALVGLANQSASDR